MNIFKVFGYKDRWRGAKVDPSIRESKKVRGALGDALKRHFPESDAALSLAEQRAEYEAKLDAQMQDPKAHYYNLDPRQKSMEKGGADEDKKNTPNGHAPEDGDNGD